MTILNIITLKACILSYHLELTSSPSMTCASGMPYSAGACWWARVLIDGQWDRRCYHRALDPYTGLDRARMSFDAGVTSFLRNAPESREGRKKLQGYGSRASGECVTPWSMLRKRGLLRVRPTDVSVRRFRASDSLGAH